jgi:hypothetical protein|tara:strand:- start:2268 stop:2444 length:177 start_codon:yes stop_codon:yes gene_type:complete
MNEVILKAENVHTGRRAELIDVDVFFGERIVYVMRYTDSGDTFRMDESYETNWIEIEE